MIMSLAAIDVGFDVRLHGITAEIPANAMEVAYDQDGERCVARGKIEQIVETLRQAGYRVRVTRPRGKETGDE